MSKTPRGNNKTAIIIICIMLVVFAAIGALFYVNEQNLTQQRELEEKELWQEKSRLKQEIEQRQEDRRQDENARVQEQADCRSDGNGSYTCYGL